MKENNFKNILENIVAFKKIELKAQKEKVTLNELSNSLYFAKPCNSFKASLTDSFGIIAEFKRKSPSAGVFASELDILETCESYQKLGAKGFSILTDSEFFSGSSADLLKVQTRFDVPVLRKDFIFDEFQIFESKAIGADAILLIAGILEKEQIHHFTILAKTLGMEVIFEVHTPEDVLKVNDEVDFIMVNNRDLRIQQTDVLHSKTMKNLLPSGFPLISASGIKTIDELSFIEDLGYNSALIGESLLRDSSLSLLQKQAVQ